MCFSKKEKSKEEKAADALKKFAPKGTAIPTEITVEIMKRTADKFREAAHELDGVAKRIESGDSHR